MSETIEQLASELNKLYIAEQVAMDAMRTLGANPARLDAWLKASGALNVAMREAWPRIRDFINEVDEQ